MFKINKILQKAELCIGAFLAAVILSVSALQIVFRYFLRKPLGWTNEVACYSLVWITFLSFAYLFSIRRHVSLTMVTNRLSNNGVHILNIIFNVIIIVGLIILLPSCIDNMNYMIVSPALKVPQQVFYVVIPTSFFLIIFHAICLILEDMAALKQNKEAK